jgi:hypothetical protein
VVAVLGQNPAWVVLGGGLAGLFGSFGKKEKGGGV